jgi:hypothetical protein
MDLEISVLADRPDLHEALADWESPWPEFMTHDPIGNMYYAVVDDLFAEYHLVACDAEKRVVAQAFSVPFELAGDELPAGTRAALDVVSVPPTLHAAMSRLLTGVAVVEDLASARRLVEAKPRLVAVTREGDILGRAHAAGGSASAPSLLEVQAAVDELKLPPSVRAFFSLYSKWEFCFGGGELIGPKNYKDKRLRESVASEWSRLRRRDSRHPHPAPSSSR